MKVNDAIIGMVLAIFSVVLFAYAMTFPPIPGQPYGPSLFPSIIAIGLFASGVTLVVSGLRERRAEPWFSAAPWMRSPRHVISFVICVGGVVFYLLAVDRLGFLLTAFILITGTCWWLRRRLPSSMVIGAIASFGVYYAFRSLLLVPLPAGPLSRLMW